MHHLHGTRRRQSGPNHNRKPGKTLTPALAAAVCRSEQAVANGFGELYRAILAILCITGQRFVHCRRSCRETSAKLAVSVSADMECRQGL